MTRFASKLAPPLFVAAVVLLASALAATRPTTIVARLAPLLLALVPLGVDRIERRRWRPSPESAILAVAILAAGELLAAEPAQLAPMIPILGACAALPWLVRRARRGEPFPGDPLCARDGWGGAR